MNDKGNKMVTVGFLVIAAACGETSVDSSDPSPANSETTVTFTVYTNAACTELPQRDSVVTLNTTVGCNETPDSSISELACEADRITYLNHPNSSDCSAEGIENVLPIGVCTEFPGPVPTWKYIVADTYACGS